MNIMSLRFDHVFLINLVPVQYWYEAAGNLDVSVFYSC